MTLVRIAVIFAVIGVAAVVVRILDRRRRHEPVIAYGMPASLDPADFPLLLDGPALALFSHSDCRACEAARRVLEAKPLPLIEIDGERALERYAIDGVPTTLVVDEGGAVVAGWVGPLESHRVDDAINSLNGVIND